MRMQFVPCRIAGLYLHSMVAGASAHRHTPLDMPVIISAHTSFVSRPVSECVSSLIGMTCWSYLGKNARSCLLTGGAIKGEKGQSHMQLDGEPWAQDIPAGEHEPLVV